MNKTIRKDLTVLVRQIIQTSIEELHLKASNDNEKEVKDARQPSK